MVPLAFEVEHRVDHVLEHLGAGQRAVLGDVPDEERRQIVALGREQELRRGLPHLTDAAGRRLELEREHRLNRVDDEQARAHTPDLLEDALDAGLGQQVERRVADAEPLAARLHLVLGLLAGRVEHRPVHAREVGRRLQQQRRLTDARLAAEQHQRAGHDAAAEHAVELVDAACQAGGIARLDVGVLLRAARAAGQRIAVTAGGQSAGAGRGFGRTLFDERVPRVAVGTTAEPLGRLAAALLTHEHRLRRLAHRSRSYTPSPPRPARGGRCYDAAGGASHGLRRSARRACAPPAVGARAT